MTLQIFGSARTDADVRARVVAYYHDRLRENPAALAFLRKRGLGSPDMVARFQIGFSDRSLGLKLPPKPTKAGGAIRERLIRLGIYRGNGREHLCGSLVVPIFDAAGDVVTLYGRKVTSNLRKGTDLHLCVPDPPAGVFNLDGLREGTVILTDSVLNALTVWCAGFQCVTAIFGPSGSADEHLAAFKANQVSQVLVAFRRTDDADKSAAALAARLADVGIAAYRVLFPATQDANDFALTSDAPQSSFDRVFRSATWLAGTRAHAVPVAPAAAPPAPEALDFDDEIGRDEMDDETHEASDDGARVQLESLSPAAENAPVTFSPLPEAPAPPAIATEISEDEVVILQGDRRYRVRGLSKNTSFDVLKVNLLASREGRFPEAAFHVDTLDLYQAKQRAAFQKQASIELSSAEDVIRHDLARVLFKLEELQEEHIRRLTAPKAQAAPPMSDTDRNDALALLRDPRLLDRVVTDLETAGLVGEATNKLLAYLVAVSRLLDDPLAMLVQSSSAAGKSTLTDAVLACVPPEDRVQFSALTGQSLFYLGEHDLKHKVLAIAEEEGARRAAYALKLLQSERRLTIGSTDKDPVSGKLVTREYKVEGPVALALTTTRIDIDDELLNRCVVLTVDEDREQTRAIHRLQRERETLAGMQARQERDRIVHLHQNAQRLLRPILVANPHAPALTFLDDRTRARRDQPKLLALIRTIALLHQHQREVKTTLLGGSAVEYIEATIEDVEVAMRLALAAFGSAEDDMPPHTRKLLTALDAMAAAACAAQNIERRDYCFTRREVRAHTGWGDTQLKVHLRRLVELEYLTVRHDSDQRRYVYQLRGGASAYDSDRAGQTGRRAGAGRPPVGEQGRPPNSTESQGKSPDFDHRAGRAAPTSQAPNAAPSYADAHRSEGSR